MIERPAARGDLRLAELMSVLSLAIDLGMGLPLELGLRTCPIGVFLGEELGLGAGVLRQVYYVTLLGVLGCTAEVHEFAELFGDETERVLAQSAAPAPLGQLAALHHERLDGSGYHRGVPASLQNASARLLAAADVYHAMIEPRPHRPAFSPEQAASNLEREVREGRLDRDAVNAVLAAAGQRARRARRTWPARHLQGHRRPPHSAYLRQDRRLDPRRGNPLRDAARHPRKIV